MVGTVLNFSLCGSHMSDNKAFHFTECNSNYSIHFSLFSPCFVSISLLNYSSTAKYVPPHCQLSLSYKAHVPGDRTELHSVSTGCCSVTTTVSTIKNFRFRK
jgi:hypothetical protein